MQCLEAIVYCRKRRMMDRIILVRNGHRSGAKVVKLPESWNNLMDVARSVLGIRAKRFFTKEGAEIDGAINLLRNDDVLYVSEGEDFISEASEASKGINRKWITLNVGGEMFTTSRNTLTSKEPESMLARMFADNGCGDFVMTPSDVDRNGAYLIDRSSRYFEPVLNYLRHGQVCLDKHLNPKGVLEEARFYGVESMIPELEHLIIRDRKMTRDEVIKALSESHRISSADLSGADMSGVNLEGLNFAGINLSLCNFRHSNMRRCRMENADLSFADFTGASLRGAMMNSCQMEGTTLTEVCLRNARMKFCEFFKADMTEADMRNADLSESSLTGCEVQRAKLEGATLTMAKLDDCNFSGANLTNTGITEEELSTCETNDTMMDYENIDDIDDDDDDEDDIISRNSFSSMDSSYSSPDHYSTSISSDQGDDDDDDDVGDFGNAYNYGC